MAGTAKERDTVYNLRIAKRNIRMSNLTPDDVDLRLSATKAELTEEDQRLWLGLEDEKISRIAGDEANKQLTELVQQQNSGTESRLSTEVIHRSEGDVSNLNSLNAVAQALSDYRIKTDLEINNEIIARKALGVSLNSRIDNFMASWDHDKFLIYRTIQEVQDDVDGKYISMDTRITKYEQMLSDITADSIQITMDNGEINMGAWTILSQAREWDLQIIGRMKDYQLATTGDLNQALEDMQNKLPVEQNIIDKAIQGLSNSQVIKDLDEKLTSNIADIGAINQDLLDEVTARQNEMIAQAQNTANAIKSQADELTAAILAETTARIDAVTREADIRTLQIEGINSSISEETAVRIEEIRLLNDGLTAEVISRVEGDQNITTSLDNYKESNDAALANVRNTVEVLVSDTAVMSQTVSSLDARLTVTEADTATANSLAASANEKATTALTATTSLAERMESVEASVETVEGDLTNKVDVVAFNSLKTEVTAIDGRVTTNTANIASITGNITDISSQLTANTNAISELSTKQTQQGNDIEQVSSQVTQLSADINSVQNAVANKADASVVASLTTQVNQQGENITLINSDITTLKGSVSTIEGNLASKADVTAFNALDSKVTTVDGKVTALNSNVISLESRVTTAEAGIATKADASALNDIYTKTESDNAIAGKIESYDANLVIGGTNLFTGTQEWLGTWTNIWAYEKTNDYYKGLRVLRTVANWTGVHQGIMYDDNVQYTISAWIKKSQADVAIHFWGDNLSGDSGVGTHKPTEPGVWTRVTHTFKGTGQVGTARFEKVDNGSTGSYDICGLKVERGNKATDYTPAPEDVASDINKVQANLSNFQEAQANVDLAQTNRLNAAESQLGANTARITNVEQTYATRDGVAALARNALQAEWQTYANDSVNNLQIGGRNLILHSNYSTNPYKIYFAGGSYSQFGLSPVPDQSEAVLDTDTFITVSVWYTQLDSIDINKPFESLTIGRQDLNADPWNIRLRTTDASIKIVKEGNLYKLTGTVLIPKGGQLFANYPRFITISGYGCYLHKIKIEKGSKATDYSPAPEDLIQDLNTFKSTVETVYSTKAEANSTTADIINRLTSKANQSGLDALSADVANNYYTKAQTDSVTAGVVNSYKAELGNIINYTVVSRGNEIGGVGYILNAQGNWIVGGSRSYTLVVFNSDGTINWSRSYDIFGQGSPANQVLYDDINALPNGVYALIFTSDEPSAGRDANLIFPALRMLGGTREVNDKLGYRGSYMLIGRKGMVEGTAVEMVAPSNQTITYGLQFVNGVPVGIGNTALAMPSQFASASALSTLDTKVTAIDGRITSQASSITQLQTDVAGNSAKLIVQGEVVDGLKASYVVKTDVNGLVAGYGLYNTGSTSAFGVNADYFYVGKSDAGGKKPFMILNSPQTIGGVTYPAGTWIDVALIANATIGTAHIADASITNAKIASLDAAKITSGYINADRIEANSISAKKLMLQDTTNLWGNRYFDSKSLSVDNAPLSPNPGCVGNAIYCERRDHIGEWASRYPVRKGDVIVTEFTARAYKGSGRDLNSGVWVTNSDGAVTELLYIAPEWLGTVSGSWNRYRSTVIIGNSESAFARLFFQIEQAGDGSGAYGYDVCDVVQRRALGGELLVDGSITADKLSVNSLSAISANLGTIQVGSANIADLAVTAAHISDAAITSAKIGDLEVNTLKIANNAVSNSLASATGSALSFTSTGSPIRINVGLDHRRTSGGSAKNFTDTVSLLRDGVVIKTWSFTSWWDTGNGTNTLQVKAELPMIIDTPGAGTFTYSLSGVGTKTLALLEIKK